MPVLPTDTFFAEQWHLLNTGQSGGTAGVDLHIFEGETSVWDEFTGAGVSIGVIDDGIDYTHVDLDDNYDASLEGSVDGYHPNTGDSHGTAVAGIIAAENNGVGVVGVAYDSSVTSLPAITSGGLDFLEALQLGQNFDIVNNSWGYNFPFVDNPNDPAFAADFAAMETMLTDGRDGLGTIFVKSAGNGRASGDNANSSGTNTFHGSVTVAAIDHNGFVSEYSSEGSSILVSAFGGNFTDPGRIWTTDRSDGFGYNDVAADEDYTQGFNGTSAAAPMVSGVVALMLDANEGLGWRDVQTILSYTARHTGTDIGSSIISPERYDWQWNGANDWNNGALHFSNDYGFGVVDALAAVRLAEYWSITKTSASLDVISVDASIGTPIAIPDDDPVGISFTIDVTDDIAIENLRLTLQGDHTFVGDLQIELTSPDGTTNSLWLNNEGSTDFPSLGWVLSSNLFRGEDSAGIWTVAIRDVVGADTGSITGATLEIEGADELSAAADTYIYTNEYSDYADPSRNTLTDTDGGLDELNASAVTSGSVINLTVGATSTIDGVAFTMNGAIEWAVGGDGADAITGEAGVNRLTGGRGNDTINGGADADTMIGAAGNDTFIVDNAGDQTIEAVGGGGDTVRASVSYTLGATQQIETLTTTNAAGTGAINLTGNEFNNAIQGNAGVNTLNGGAGVDTMTGFAGNDTYIVDNASDRPIEAAGGGADTVRTSVSYGLFAGQEIETLTTTNAAGIGAINLSGNEINNAIQGNAGNNGLTGRGGADTMTGFAGNDIYVIDNAGDRAIEAVGGGADTVQTSVSYGLFGGQEIETLTTNSDAGVAAINLSGNEFNNAIRGNAGNNGLTGKLGADTMTGLGGNDIYVVDNAGDRTIEAVGGGADTVQASVTYVLQVGQAIETLNTDNVAGTGAIDLTGNEFSQAIRGNAGNNVIAGRAGADTLFGFGGNDTFSFNTSLGASNIDNITDFVAANDTIRLDDDVFTALATGTLAAAAFKDLSLGAQDADDRILYNKTSGALLYDGDGIGGTGPVQFATLDTKPTITNVDFFVVA